MKKWRLEKSTHDISFQGSRGVGSKKGDTLKSIRTKFMQFFTGLTLGFLLRPMLFSRIQNVKTEKKGELKYNDPAYQNGVVCAVAERLKNSLTMVFGDRVEVHLELGAEPKEIIVFGTVNQTDKKFYCVFVATFDFGTEPPFLILAEWTGTCGFTRDVAIYAGEERLLRMFSNKIRAWRTSPARGLWDAKH